MGTCVLQANRIARTGSSSKPCFARPVDARENEVFDSTKQLRKGVVPQPENDTVTRFPPLSRTLSPRAGPARFFVNVRFVTFP